jgi:GT2 family glycosyltransferase
MNIYKTKHNLDHHREEMNAELLIQIFSTDEDKDILIVVKDQLEYVRRCVDSIYEHTDRFRLYLWDNASDQPTKEYLESLTDRYNVTLVRSETNEGFLKPNNRLAERGSSPYIILLNSDTQVRQGWDRLMTGWLKQRQDTLLVGYGGCRFNENLEGGVAADGYEIDYLGGWSLCLSRETFGRFGLFDEINLQFCYGEDADLSMRLSAAGAKIYSFHLDLISHFENKTIMEVQKDEDFRKWFAEIFRQNHDYLRRRWGV